MIFFDSHVHFYKDYDIDRLFDAFWTNARRNAPTADAFVMALALRSFQKDFRQVLLAAHARRWKVDFSDAGCAFATLAEKRLTIVPARQIAAHERIELLGLFCDAMIPDGLGLSETWDALLALSYEPVLAWGLGKWLLRRARHVDELICEAASGRRLFIGDSAVRPTFWGIPPPFRRATEFGLRILHGSDPLPRVGEEANAGRYGSLIGGRLDSCAPAASLRTLLGDSSLTITPCGKRRSLVETLKNL